MSKIKRIVIEAIHARSCSNGYYPIALERRGDGDHFGEYGKGVLDTLSVLKIIGKIDPYSPAGEVRFVRDDTHVVRLKELETTLT